MSNIGNTYRRYWKTKSHALLKQIRRFNEHLPNAIQSQRMLYKLYNRRRSKDIAQAIGDINRLIHNKRLRQEKDYKQFNIPFGSLSASLRKQTNTLKRGHVEGRIGTLHGKTAVVGQEPEPTLYTQNGVVHSFKKFVPSKKILRNPTNERIHKYLKS